MDFFIIFLMLYRVQIVVILGIIVLSVAYKKGHITDNNLIVFIIIYLVIFISRLPPWRYDINSSYEVQSLIKKRGMILWIFLLLSLCYLEYRLLLF